MNLSKLILLVVITTLGYYTVVYLYWNREFDLITGSLFALITISYAALLGCSIIIADRASEKNN